MARANFNSNSMLPAVLVAGILSGGLWRSAPPADAGKSEGPAGGADKADFPPPTAPWVSDLRPAMDSMAAALGIDPMDLESQVLAHASDVTLEKAGDARDRQILTAMSDLRTGLRTVLDDRSGFTCAEVPQINKAAEVVGASFLADNDSDAKTRREAANALLDEYRNWRLLLRLASGVHDSEGSAGPHYHTDFIVATIPDYVDSNSGWLADQNLAAIQSGLIRSQYILDRVKLIDWSRAAASSAVTVSGSRLHERQPGALIFRRVDDDDDDKEGRGVHLQVVLLVLKRRPLVFTRPRFATV